MKVSLFSSWQVPCGIAEHAHHLVAALQALGEQVSVVPFDRRPHPRTDYVNWGRMMNAGDVAHIQHEYTFFGYLLPWRNYYHAFTSQIRKPLVITKHVSFDGPLILADRGYMRLVRQIKWSLYNRWLGPYATYLNKDTFDIAQQIIVLNEVRKDQLIARGIRPEKISVIPPGVPDVLPAVGGEPLRAQWGWRDKCIIGVFGFITPAKGHTVALDALARLPDEYTLLIAGGLRREADRDILDVIQQRIIQLDLSQRVRITGFLDEADIPVHISACDILVYPYTHADFSTSVVLGMAYQSAPVIVSDVATHRELAERCRAVALFRSADPVDLARTIQDIMYDEAHCLSLLRGAKQFAQENSWLVVARKTRDVYVRAMNAFSQGRCLVSDSV